MLLMDLTRRALAFMLCGYTIYLVIGLIFYLWIDLLELREGRTK